jgi:glycosyltransferase involved in cell wall biosynthesis
MYVSIVAPRKGHLLLLEAFDVLRTSGVPVELTIVGRQGWMVEDVAAAITTHPEFGRTLHWRRSATDADIAEVARRCHIGVVPAEDEGYGLFLDESLALGLACVARDIPVFRERAGYPNLTFFDGSAHALAEAVLEAQATPLQALAPGTIRTMTDFTDDLSGLVAAALA